MGLIYPSDFILYFINFETTSLNSLLDKLKSNLNIFAAFLIFYNDHYNKLTHYFDKAWYQKHHHLIQEWFKACILALELSINLLSKNILPLSFEKSINFFYPFYFFHYYLK